MKREKCPQRLLIVDGYNVLNARGRLNGAAELADARERLLREMQDYAGYSGQRIVLVFDAWQADRTTRSEQEYGPVTVVFTQKGETADHYIERLCDDCAEDIEFRRTEVRVATSDALEQTIVLGRGATRMSSRELLMEMNQVRESGAPRVSAAPKRSTVADRLPEDVVRRLKEMYGGK